MCKFHIIAWRIPVDRRTWWATVHGVAKSPTHTHTHSTHTQSIIISTVETNVTAVLESEILSHFQILSEREPKQQQYEQTFSDRILTAGNISNNQYIILKMMDCVCVECVCVCVLVA